MKYKVGDKVRIKSKDWYEKNKEEDGYVRLSQRYFNEDMCMYCGKIATIEEISTCHGYIRYQIDIDNCHFFWDDGMFEEDFDFKQLEVGETFSIEGKTYRVDEKSGCKECAFSRYLLCGDISRPHCSLGMREDEKDVIFTEIKKTMDSKEERNIKVDIVTARKWYNGSDDSLKTLALQAFSESELKNNVKVWKDLFNAPKNYKGCYIQSDSLLGLRVILSNRDKCVFVDDKHAKSALAMAQISQLIPYYTEPIARNEGNWVIIADGHGDFITQQYNYKSNPNILRFKTIEQANDFLNNNEQLVRDYFMIN